jgi:hypothetical protein
MFVEHTQVSMVCPWKFLRKMQCACRITIYAVQVQCELVPASVDITSVGMRFISINAMRNAVAADAS